MGLGISTDSNTARGCRAQNRATPVWTAQHYMDMMQAKSLGEGGLNVNKREPAESQRDKKRKIKKQKSAEIMGEVKKSNLTRKNNHATRQTVETGVCAVNLESPLHDRQSRLLLHMKEQRRLGSLPPRFFWVLRYIPMDIFCHSDTSIRAHADFRIGIVAGKIVVHTMRMLGTIGRPLQCL